MRKTIFIVLFVNVAWLIPAKKTHAQSDTFPLKEWVRQLSTDSDTAIYAVYNITFSLRRLDMASQFGLADEMYRLGRTKNPYFRSRYHLLRALMLYYLRQQRPQLSQSLKDAFLTSYETNNEIFIATISWNCGQIMYDLDEFEQAVVYCLNGTEIFDKNKVTVNMRKYGLLGEILYYARDYKKSIHYTAQSNADLRGAAADERLELMNNYNTSALCWQKMGMYDSAFAYYKRAWQIADEQNSEIWRSIISGNIGQIYYLQKQYAQAKPLLLYDAETGARYREFANSGNSMQWAARVSLMQGKIDSAMLEAQAARQLLFRAPEVVTQRKLQSSIYLQNLYNTLADVHRASGNTDSFYYFSKLYINLHDSIESTIAKSEMGLAKMKLDNLESIFKLQGLQKQKEAERLKRNFAIAFIFLVAIIALLYLNRQRAQSRLKEQLARQQKQIAEDEIRAAREQLQLFTRNLVDKSNLVEKLEGQLAHKALSIQQQQLADELSKQTILTEADWEKFKTLYEKIHPGFFQHLKEKVSDITVAEQRMAALTRLHLTSKQMASILGISVDSVHKTRQRLRQRLQLAADVRIENFLAEL